MNRLNYITIAIAGILIGLTIWIAANRRAKNDEYVRHLTQQVTMLKNEMFEIDKTVGAMAQESDPSKLKDLAETCKIQLESASATLDEIILPEEGEFVSGPSRPDR